MAGHDGSPPHSWDRDLEPQRQVLRLGRGRGCHWLADRRELVAAASPVLIISK